MSWSSNDPLYPRYIKIKEEITRLQKELGVEPLTLEQRYQRYRDRLAQEAAEAEKRQRQQEEFKRMQALRNSRPTLRRPK